MSEKRRHPRTPRSEHTIVYWTDANGRFFQEKAAVTDSSVTGLCVAMRNRIGERTQVGLRSTPDSITVRANVRNVRQRGLFFLTGLELPTPE